MQILLLISLPLIHQAHHRAPSIIRGLTKMKTESWPGMGKRNLCKLTAADVTWTNTFLFHYAGKNHEFLLFIRQFTDSWEIFCIEGSLTNFDKIEIYFSTINHYQKFEYGYILDQSLEHFSLINNHWIQEPSLVVLKSICPIICYIISFFIIRH